MSCCCFNDYISNCATEIIINAGLTPATEYIVQIKDKFDNLYNQTITAGPSGELTVDITQLPVGLLTEYSGGFTITVFEGCDTVNLTLNETEYTCIDLEVKKSNTEKNQIPCA